MRGGGGPEIISSLVTGPPGRGCDAGEPGGAAQDRAGGPSVGAAERERERAARVNITTYYSHYEPSQQRTAATASHTHHK